MRQLIVFFPVIHLGLILLCFGTLIQSLSFSSIVIFLAVVYLFPIICFQIQDFFIPLKEGRFDFSRNRYCPWWGTHQMQQVYAAIPHLEAVLRIVPGAYSIWLRLWGAKIGKHVYWTPRIEVIDRNLIEIGNNSIVGHRAAMCSHLISKENGKLVLTARKVRIGHAVMVGAGSRLGPGTTISDHITVPVCTDLLLNQHIIHSEQLKKNHYDPISRPVEPTIS